MDGSNGTTIIRVKRKREADPIDSLVICAALKRTPKSDGQELEQTENEAALTQTHVFKLLDTVGLKATGNQTARIVRKIRRVFKKHNKIADSLDDRKTQRLEQQRRKKNADLENRRKWNDVVNEWEDFSISDTLASSAKPEPSKPIFKKRARNTTSEKNSRTDVNEIDFVDVDMNNVMKTEKVSPSKKAAPSPIKSPSRVLNPQQRRMDEAIFTGFKTGDASNLAQVVAQFKDVNFVREIDGTTPLMTAAWYVLSLSPCFERV